MKTVNSEFGLSVGNQELAPVGFSAWLVGFPLVSAGLFAAQLSGAAALCLSATVAVTMAAVAHASVLDADNDGKFEAKQRIMSFLAPAQFALLMWLAVSAGGALGSTYMSSSAIAFAAFAGLVAADFVASAIALFAMERNEGVSGLSLASLINGKYSGLLGRLI
jgi:hypothetical protein